MLNMKKLLIKLLQNQKPVVLWTNPNPNESFAARDVNLTGAYDSYAYIEVEYKASTSQATDLGMKLLDKTPCHAQSVASMVMYSDSGYWELYHRARWWNPAHTAMHFDTAYYNVLSNNATGSWDGNMIPYKIYGYLK